MTIQVDDGHVRVARWDFPPGTETGDHVHEFDYVVVPITDGELTIELPDGSTMPSPILVGASYARQAGVAHNVVNLSDAHVAFVEIELLDRPSA